MGIRRRLIGLAAVAILACTGNASAGAQESTTTEPTTPSTVMIDTAFGFSGAEITRAGTAPRHLDAYQAAVFVQSWIVEGIYGKPEFRKPPAGAPVFRVDVTGTWNGGSELSTRAAYYATDGARAAYVALASPADTPPTGVPKTPLNWFIAPNRTVSAFAGTAKLVPTLGIESATTTTTLQPAPREASSAGGAAWPWIVGGGVIIIAIAGGYVLARRRRSG